MRMQFNDDKRVLPAVCFAFVLGIVLMLSSVWGHVHVYLLQDAGSVSAIVENQYVAKSSTNNGNSTPRISYSFQVGEVRYEGKEDSYQRCEIGDKINVYYMYEAPEKNGLLKVKLPMLLFGVVMMFFSLAGMIHSFKNYFRRGN